MISFNELLHGHNIVDISTKQQQNLQDLQKKLNKFRAAYGKLMTVTSGVRLEQDQLRIYRSKGIPDSKIPMGSAHLKGCAADFEDKDGSLMTYCRANISLLEECGLWCEDGTVGWVHMQSYAPASGNRFFKP